MTKQLSRCLWRGVLLIGAFAMLMVACRRAEPAGPPAGPTAMDDSVRRVVALLDYVAADYPGAIAGGDPTEYQEQISFIADAGDRVSRLPAPASGSPKSVHDAIAEARRLVAAKATPDEVTAACRRARSALLAAYPVLVAPRETPSRELGASTFGSTCAPCHGASGGGDGPAAAGLHPPPRSFRDAGTMLTMSPARVFAAVTDGVPGTAMVSFASRPEADRWSLAFYVMSLRFDAPPADVGTVPTLPQPWENPRSLNPRMASAFEIMIDGPLGGAAFNNEFGRPNLTGYFRSFELPTDHVGVVRAYDKPIMLAGGVGAMDRAMVKKLSLRAGDSVIVLGGPAMLIGLGGGAASSVGSGQSSEALDFASVQRDNPEMERRCQEVIDRCVAMNEHNPIRFMHDVGAGGLSNAIPELLHDCELGGVIELAKIPSDDPSLSPMQLWSNESQERYVLGVAAEHLPMFEAICLRERCPFAVVGITTQEQRLVLQAANGERAVDMPMDMLFGNAPKMHRDAQHVPTPRWPKLDTNKLSLHDAGLRVLAHPTVAAKNFLITIGDRTVGGLCSRDQMVGPWQLPLADCAITLTDFFEYAGEAMAVGERTPLALIDAAASARMAVGEALTNLAAAPVASLSEVKLSANWMAAASYPGEDALLFDAVKAIGMELCPELDISIPVGKDSLSMQAQWQADGQLQQSVSPVSLIVSAFARVADARGQLTPVFNREIDSELWLIGLGAGKQRLGGSILGQCHDGFGGACPDVDDPGALRSFFDLIQFARADQLLLAYHDRSDGGAFAALCEMAFASRMGLELSLDEWGDDPFKALFNEELGAVVQIASEDRVAFADLVNRHDLTHCAQRIGRPTRATSIRIEQDDRTLVEWSWQEAFDAWWSVTHAMQKLRDNPDCADEERAIRRDFAEPGLLPVLTFDPDFDVAAPFINIGAKPRVAILREQGVNSQYEMAAAFTKAGFTAVDVHMSDLIAGRVALDQFKGFAACGGFSYGDVLGAGRGWATSILERSALREQFAEFFARSDSFSLGVCNGCQMLTQLKGMIPGAEHWPRFLRNRSEQFEARLALVEVLDSPSLFFKDMAGSRIPIVVSHGEGRAEFDAPEHTAQAHVALRFIDGQGQVATRYPTNPNGSPEGITGLTSADGRSTLLMPHPERVHRTVQMSWHPADWGEASPWLRLFRNARVWVG